MKNLTPTDALIRLCANATSRDGLEKLIEKVNELLPGTSFSWALTRGGWHRLGGVVDANYNRVAGSIVQWVEENCGGDVDELVSGYVDAGFFATQLAGRTHFITHACGNAPQDFIQIEIEELQEVLDRPLVQRDWYPDSIEEFLEPLDYPRLAAEPVAEPFFQFRRIIRIAQLLSSSNHGSRQIQDLQRYFVDWRNSSAGECAHFSRHWVLALREYRDREGELKLTAKPVSTYVGEVLELPPGEQLRGVGLAKAIHAYDRRIGYPFAWFFMMLSQKARNYALAEAVLADQMGAYAYLPARDLKVLREWERRPYAV